MHITWPWQTRFPGLLVCTFPIRIYVLMPQILRRGREGSYVTIDYCQTLRWKASRPGMRRSQPCGQGETHIYRRGLPFYRLSPPRPGEDLARTIVDGTSLFCGEEHHFPSRFLQGGICVSLTVRGRTAAVSNVGHRQSAGRHVWRSPACHLLPSPRQAPTTPCND